MAKRREAEIMKLLDELNTTNEAIDDLVRHKAKLEKKLEKVYLEHFERTEALARLRVALKRGK